MDRINSEQTVQELLLHLLSHTSTDVIDDLVPEQDVSLDEIATMILNRHTHELLTQQRSVQPEADVLAVPGWAAIWNLAATALTDKIDPETAE